MKQIVKNYPYPILIKGLDDYNEKCHFVVTLLNKEVQESYLEFSFKIDLVSKYLRDLIANNNALIVCQIVCKNTLYREKKTYSSIDEDFIIRVLKGNVKERIILSFFVVSNTLIKNAKSEDFNDEYFADVDFTFEKNDRLAIGESFSVAIDDYDSLRPLSSIVTIRKSSPSDPFVKVDCNDNKINILLNEETFNRYADLKSNGDLKIYLSSIIVLPALVEALSNYKYEASSYSEYRWYSRITKFLEEQKMNIDDEKGLYYIANQLLKNSLGNSFINLKNYFEQGQKEQTL